MFLLLIFDKQNNEIKTPSKLLHIYQFDKMKDMIKLSNGKINYYDVRRTGDPKYNTRRGQYRVIKI
jgi:hypothetical protein